MTDETISHYKVLGELGRGGMGLVYKAEDTRLDRTVALKVLPGSALVSDDDRSRFYREARAAASLHHPNIATVFEIDEYDRGGDSGPYIAMEFIDGETLAERIAKGPVPLDDVVSIGSSIARALKAAHDKGIVHRDIKSANIMLNSSGDVKVLDFGLAKLSESSLLTQQGTTLGTIAYMSPEQARGKGIDHQSDIWSLGVVLYEMISGRLPFQGDYSEATIYAILNNDPIPLTSLRTGVPMDLERIVFKCLAKDKSLRYQNVDEIPADLAAVNFDLASSSSISAYLTTAAPVSTPVAAASKKRVLSLVLGVVVAGMVGALIGWFARPNPERAPRPTTRFVIELPSEQQMLPYEDSYSAIAISRDGQSIVYLGGTRGSLFWRQFDQLESVNLPGTDNAARPFFSPDGSEIAFFKRRLGSPSLYTLELGGGAPIFLTDDVNSNFRDAIWLDDGTIAYTDQDCGISRISPQNGEREVLVERMGEETCLAPLLTDHSGPGTLLLRVSHAGLTDLAAVDVPSGNRKGRHRSAAWHYANGDYYAYMDVAASSSVASGMSSLQLLVAPFDLDRMEFRGRPSVVEGGNLDYGHAAFSAEGTFVYLKSSRKGEIVWMDRDGRVSSAEGEVPAGLFGDPSFSPDGRRIAIVQGAPSTGYALHVVDRQTGRVSELPGAGGVVWMPDGRSLIYSTCPAYPLCWTLRTSADLSRQPDTLLANRSLFATSLSQDGRWLTLTDFGGSVSNLKVLDLETGDLNPLLDESQGSFGAQFSPIGEWYGHYSVRNGNAELLVSSIDGSASVLVDRDATSWINWSPIRSELFYISPRGMMAATYQSNDDEFTITSEELLFELSGPPTMEFDYDPVSDRFLFARSDPSVSDSILVVRNWIADLERSYQ